MKSRPHILVYIGNDDPTRGDAHGLKGIGAQLVDILDGQLHYVEAGLLDELYPGQDGAERKLRLYFNDHAFPDIILTTNAENNSEDAVGALGEQHNATLFLSLWNENLAKRYLADSPIVANHLTPQLLNQEGEKFRKAYPDLPRPLIALLFDQSFARKDAERLMSKCAAYPEATIFACGSRLAFQYRDVLAVLEKHREIKNLESRVRIEGYDFFARRKEPPHYNPYIGLLDQADHIIVESLSSSLLCEPLAAGKPVFFSNLSNCAGDLEKIGLAHRFNDCARDQRFETLRIEPVNATRKIAEGIAAEYEKKVSASRS